mgnify:FL=1
MSPVAGAARSGGCRGRGAAASPGPVPGPALLRTAPLRTAPLRTAPLRTAPPGPALIFTALLLIVSAALAGAGCRGRTADAPEPEAAAGEDAPLAVFGSGAGDSAPVALVGPPAAAIVMTRDLLGYTEPCGCTEELQVGGIDRVVGVARSVIAQSASTLVIEGGNAFFSGDRVAPALVAQERQRAMTVAQALRLIGPELLVVGPNDLAMGLDVWRELVSTAGGRPVAANLRLADGAPLAERWVVTRHGGLSIAVTGLVDPELVPESSGVVGSDPIAAMADAHQDPAVAGADLRVVFVHGDGPPVTMPFGYIASRWLVVRVNRDAPADDVRALAAHRVVTVHDQARAVGVLQLYAPAPPPAADVGSGSGSDTVDAAEGEPSDEESGTQERPVEATAWLDANLAPVSRTERAELEQLASRLDEQIAMVRRNLEPGEPEPALLARLVERQRGYRERLEQAPGGPVTIPPSGGWIWQVIALDPALPADLEAAALRTAFNRSLRDLNRANATPPRPPAEGQPGYVGSAACQSCHQDAHAQWAGTPHATAWHTLEQRDKDWDLSCIGCHLTGYRRPGGSSLGHVEGLEGVQCESCHGPGSLHVGAPTLAPDAGGVRRDVPSWVCAGCHNAEHSPRFDYDVWLPRVLGPGHGVP